MGSREYFYRFNPIPVFDEKGIKKYNSVLTSFDCLEEQFTKLESAYNNVTDDRADITVNVLPKLWGVIEMSVFHKIKYKLFSRKVKSHYFYLCVEQYNSCNQLSLFFYKTEDFAEVKQFFRDLIEKQTIPDLGRWKRSFIG